MYVASYGNHTIGEYSTSGDILNSSFISLGGSFYPCGIALSGSDLFVANNVGTNIVGEWTTSGAIVNSSLISGSNGAVGVAVSGSDVFVANSNANTIGEYTTSGATVNAALVSGLNGPADIAVVPEPSSWAMLAAGAGLLLALRRRVKV